jgi:hypothetical protein
MAASAMTDERDPGLSHLHAWLRRALEPRNFAVLLFAGAAAISLVYMDRNLPFQDEGATLANAGKLLRGGVFYRDIDSYPLPGAAYLLAASMALFGEHLDVARGLAAAAFCGWVMALYAVALRLLGSARAALFGALSLAFKFIAWPAFTSYMYFDLSFTAGCVAVALLLAGRSFPGNARLIAAGLCVGAAVSTKQSLGIPLAVACVIVLLPIATPWRLAGVSSLRPSLVFCGALFAPLALAGAWFASQGLLASLFYSGFVRPFSGYLPTGGIAFTPMLAWWQFGSLDGAWSANYLMLDYLRLLMAGSLPGAATFDSAWWMLGEFVTRSIYTSASIAIAWFGVRSIRALRRADAASPDRPLMSFGLLAAAIAVSAFPRADLMHVTCVYPPVLLLGIALVSQPDRPLRRPLLAIVAVAGVLLLSGSMALGHWRLLTHRVVVERADVRVAAEEAWMQPIVELIVAEVPQDASFFVYGHEAHVYFLSGRYFPWPFPQLYPGQVGENGGAQIVERLERDPPRVIVRGMQYWPNMPKAYEYAPRLDRWIRDHYRRDEQVFATRSLPPGAVEPAPLWMSLLRFQGGRVLAPRGARSQP